MDRRAILMARLEVLDREIEDLEAQLASYDKVDQTHRALKTIERLNEPQTNLDKVLEVCSLLGRGGGIFRNKQVQEQCPNISNIHTMLRRLSEEGHVTRVGHGRWKYNEEVLDG